jgi:hypothetical protein
MKFRITMVNGPYQGQSSDKELDQLVIGSAASASGHLQVAHASIAPQHLLLYVHQEQVYGRSLYNGVIIEDGFRNEGDFPVFSGKIYELSPDVHLRIEWGDDIKTTGSRAASGIESKSNKAKWRNWPIRGVLQFIGAFINLGFLGLLIGLDRSLYEEIGVYACIYLFIGIAIFVVGYLFQPKGFSKWISRPALAVLFIVPFSGYFETAKMYNEEARLASIRMPCVTEASLKDFDYFSAYLIPGDVDVDKGPSFSGEPGISTFTVFNGPSRQFVSEVPYTVLAFGRQLPFSEFCDLYQSDIPWGGDWKLLTSTKTVAGADVCKIEAEFQEGPFLGLMSRKYCHTKGRAYNRVYILATVQTSSCENTQEIHNQLVDSFRCK